MRWALPSASLFQGCLWRKPLVRGRVPMVEVEGTVVVASVCQGLALCQPHTRPYQVCSAHACGPSCPTTLVFQILPSLQASGAMLDMVDSCSMLYRLQMEGGGSSGGMEGSPPPSGPRARQEAITQLPRVLLQALGQYAWPEPGPSSAAASQLAWDQRARATTALSQSPHPLVQVSDSMPRGCLPVPQPAFQACGHRWHQATSLWVLLPFIEQGR